MKKLLLSVLTCLAFTVQIAARNGFAIVIDSVSYQEARPEVDAYARAIERLHGLKVYTVIDRWQVPDSIRATLKHLHEQKSEPIVGTVFVGDIPIVMVRDAQHLTSAFKMNQKNDRRESSVLQIGSTTTSAYNSSFRARTKTSPIFIIPSLPKAARKSIRTCTADVSGLPTRPKAPATRSSGNI